MTFHDLASRRGVKSCETLPWPPMRRMLCAILLLMNVSVERVELDICISWGSRCVLRSSTGGVRRIVYIDHY